MGATVIDSFVVELGLDPSKFDAKQKKVVQSFKQTQDELESRAKNAEKTVESTGGAIAGLARQASGFFAAVGAGKFLVSFASGTIEAAASVNRLSRSIGVGTETITKWQGLAKIFGGDASAMANSFTTLSDAFAGWKVGIVSPMIADFRAISTAGGKVIDVNKGVEQSLFDLADNMKAIADRGPEGQAQAGLLGRRLGLDPASIDLLMQGSARLKQELAAIKGLTKENADEATKLSQRWNAMINSAQTMGQSALFKTIDFGKRFMNKMSTGNSMGWRDDGKEEPLTAFDRPKAPAAAATASTGAFKSQEEKAEFIRDVARRNGIDPEVALRVAKTEGFNNFVSTVPGEKSYGAFQLNISKNPSRPSLGDKFVQDTGLDPSKPETEKQGIEYALKYAATSGRGWADWYGARNNGIGQFAGIGQGGGASTSTTTIDTVNITVPPGSDGRQIGREFQEAVTARQSRAANANTGGQ